MLIVFIIIQLTFEVLWSGSNELMTKLSHLRLAITINSHNLLDFHGGGGQSFRPPSWLRLWIVVINDIENSTGKICNIPYLVLLCSTIVSYEQLYWHEFSCQYICLFHSCLHFIINTNYIFNCDFLNSFIY